MPHKSVHSRDTCDVNDAITFEIQVSTEVWLKTSVGVMFHVFGTQVLCARDHFTMDAKHIRTKKWTESQLPLYAWDEEHSDIRFQDDKFSPNRKKSDKLDFELWLQVDTFNTWKTSFRREVNTGSTHP